MPLPVATTAAASAIQCWRCRAAIDADDHYCRRCGEGQGRFLPWYYSPVWVVVLALTALGPFVLPLVWRTPRLDRTAKVIVSAIVIAVTGYVAWQLGIAVGDLAELLGGP